MRCYSNSLPFQITLCSLSRWMPPRPLHPTGTIGLRFGLKQYWCQSSVFWVLLVENNTIITIYDFRADWSTRIQRSGPRSCWRNLSLCHKEPAKGTKSTPCQVHFTCLELVLYGMRELAKQHDINQSEQSHDYPRATNESGPGCLKDFSFEWHL